MFMPFYQLIKVSYPMKGVMLLLVVTLMCTNLNAQNDNIYTTDGDTIINCSIQSVSKGNIIYYLFNSEEHQVQAKAFYRNGIYVPLPELAVDFEAVPLDIYTGTYKGQNFEHYFDLYMQAKKKRNIGRGLTFFGFGVNLIGALILIQEQEGPDGIIMYFSGSAMMNVGIALWISGGVKTANNQKAMEGCKKDVRLTFGNTPNGIGFMLGLKY